MDVLLNSASTFLHSGLLQLIYQFIRPCFGIFELLLQFVLFRHTLVTTTRYYKGSQAVIMVLSLPYVITAFLQLFNCFANCTTRWYDFQHEWAVLVIATAPDKTFRLKVEVMPTGGWSQYINEIHDQIIGSELDITVYFEKHVPG